MGTSRLFLLLAPLVLALPALAQEATRPSGAAVVQADSLTRVVVTLYNEGRYTEAERPAREALALLAVALGPAHPDVAASANKLARVLLAQGDYAAARPLFERALAIREAALGPGHPDVAVSLNDLAYLLREQGDYAAARPLHERALAIREAALGPGHPDVAVSLNNLGNLLLVQGDYAAARPLLERAAGILEQALGSGHPDVATSLSDLAALLWEQGDYVAAQPLLERALTIRETALAPDHPDVAQSLNNLALLLQTQGDYAAARPLFERALAIREAALGPGHPDVAVSLNNLAMLLQDLGDYAAARPLFERALAIRERMLGPGHPDVVTSLNNLAMLLVAQGDHAAARPLLEWAVEEGERVLGPEHPRVASSLNNLAVLLDRQGDDAAARPMYERALAARESALGPGHPDVAVSLNNLAYQLWAQGNYAAARPLFERAVAIWERALGPGHPEVALGLHNLAALLEDVGDYAAARPLSERALAIREAALGPNHPGVARSLNNLAVLLDRQGHPADARPLYTRAARVNDGFAERVLPTLAPAEQRAFVALDLGNATGVLLSTHRDGGALADAYALLGGWKGLLLHGLGRQAAVAALADDPAHAGEVARLQSLRAEVARAFRDGDPELAALTEEKERLERRLGRALPEGALADPWREGGLDGLWAALPADAALADVYRYAYWEAGTFIAWRYAAVVTTAAGPQTLVDLGDAEPLEEAVAAWRDAVTRGQAADAETAALAAALWEPLAAAFPGGTARVWVSPDGGLARVPWAALAAEQAATAGLLVAQVPSARALLALLSSAPDQEAAPGASPSLLLVGGVDFGEGPGFAPLPGTEAEVEALAALAEAAGLDATKLTAGEPTAATVAAALPGATYVHLATHGFFYGEGEASYEARRSDDPLSRTDVLGAPTGPAAAGGSNRNPLAESGLALAGANDGPGGALTAEELVGLDLSGTRLVVLSACETGRGIEVTGQGVLGLQASLAAAGARSLVMSLWKVPDASTAALMTHFYRGLWEESLAPAEALHQAQAAVRATPGWEAPVHWAAWVLAGEGW